MKKWLRKKVAPILGAFIIRFLGATVRVKVHDPENFLQKRNREPVIFAFWHHQLFLMPSLWKRFQPGHQMAALISASRDGELISDIIAQFNLRAVRGSSSRQGSTALLAMIRLLEEEKVDIAITPDGPRGPRHQLQLGLLQLAQSTGKAIVPLRITLRQKKELPSWDRFQVPYPFTRCDFFVGSPIVILGDISSDAMEIIRTKLLNEMGVESKD